MSPSSANGMPRVVSAVLDKIGSAEFRMPADIPLLATVVLATTEQVGVLVVQVDNDSPAAGGSLVFNKSLVSVFLLLVCAPNCVAETPGQALFEQKCTSCHSEARIAGKLQEKTSQGERILYLERMLPNHYAAGANERSLIIEYLTLKMAE